MVDAVTSTATTTAPGGSAKAIGSLAKDFDSFLKLLTIQLKNQDPTNPTDTNEFTNQIVQFSQVEQQINTNKNLEQLISLNKNVGVSNSLSYIGRTVEAQSKEFSLKNGAADISYSLPIKAKELKISITDENGKVIKSITPESLNPGKFAIKWDGKDVNGNVMKDGKYKISVSAKDESGKEIDVKTFFKGTVTQATFDNNGTKLFMGDVEVDSNNISSVSTISNDSETLQKQQIAQLDRLLKDMNEGKAISYIGRNVEANTPNFNLVGGKADIGYEIPNNAKSVKIKIYNEDGQVVRELSGDTEAGARHTVNWNGLDSEGNVAPDGNYQFVVDAKALDGSAIESYPFVKDKVTNVIANGVNSQVFFGDIPVEISRIISIF